MMTTSAVSYMLGIDVGTSRVKAVLVNKSTLKVDIECSKLLGAHLTVTSEKNAYERDVQEIFNCLDDCLASLCLINENSKKIVSIGVCGQMHGCVLWKSTESFLSEDGVLRVPDSRSSCSSLVTWQDGRCTPDFLSTLPKTHQPIQPSAGYGCATLAWLNQFRPDLIKQFDRAGTIMDLIVWVLCGHQQEEPGKRVVMSAQNATSWAFFDIAELKWESDILESSGFPVHLLPCAVNTPAIAGHLCAMWHGICQGTPVGVAMGDMQCSILAAQPSHSDAVLNIGSASQLSIVKPKAENMLVSVPPSLMEVPYFDGVTLLTAASLAGGNVMATFVKMLVTWMSALGVKDIPDESNLYEKLISLASEAEGTSPPEVGVTLWGERHEPEALGSVLNLTPNNLQLGEICKAMLKGVIVNLRKMMPLELFQQLKISQVLGSGEALRKNPVLQTYTENVFGLSLLVLDEVDSPKGAALAVRNLV